VGREGGRRASAFPWKNAAVDKCAGGSALAEDRRARVFHFTARITSRIASRIIRECILDFEFPSRFAPSAVSLPAHADCVVALFAVRLCLPFSLSLSLFSSFLDARSTHGHAKRGRARIPRAAYITFAAQ